MSLGLTCRLVARPRWGRVRRAYSQSLISNEAIRRAQKSGGMKSVRLFTQDKAGREAAYQGDDSDARAIGLSAQILFPAAYNTKAGQWEMQTGDDADLLEFTNVFDGPGLGYINHRSSTEENAKSIVRSVGADDYDGTTPVGSGGFPLLKNAPWAIEFFLPKPVEDDPCPVFQLRWPGALVGRKKFPGWVFQVIKGQAEICLLAPAAVPSPGWTQTREDELFSLLAIENPTSENQEDIDEIRAEIYAVRQSVSFTGEWYNAIKHLEFYPEQRGVLTITDGAQSLTVRHPEIVKLRRDFALWNAGTVRLGSNGHDYFWRAGFPWFAPQGTLGFGRTKSRLWSDDLPSMQFTVLKDVNGPGTSCTLANNVLESTPAEDESVTVVSSEVVATLATSHRRYTPYLYAAHAYIPAGARSGGTSVLRDTGDAEFLDAAGNGPIIDVIPQFENGRRCKYTVVVRDAKGSTFEGLGLWYDTLEGCVCDLYVGGTRVVCDGIILSARIKELATGEYNLPRNLAYHEWTVVEFEIGDQSHILDEKIIREDPVGDFQNLGVFNKKLLNLAGIPNSKINIAPGGALNPTARPGEDWATRPGKAVSLGDYIRRHNEKHGLGMLPPWIDTNGVWQWTARPTAVATIEGHEAHFSSDPAITGPYEYPARFAVLAPLESIRELNDFYNLITVEGAEDDSGTPLVATWEITHSIQIIGPQTRSYIGREREYYVSDSGLRTLDDVLRVRRSLALVYGDPPRYFAFRTYYHVGLFPGDLITVDGTLCRIVSLGGSARDGFMNIVARECA